MPLIVGDLGPARWDLGAPGKRLGKRLGRLGKVPDKYLTTLPNLVGDLLVDVFVRRSRGSTWSSSFDACLFHHPGLVECKSGAHSGGEVHS